jgi:polyferredoxin
MVTVINSINFLRIVTFIVAAAFVPAFLYGVASVWMVVAGVVSALFFNARLKLILNQSIYKQDKKKNAWLLVKKYSLLILEISIIMPLPIILFLNLSTVDGEFIRPSLDSVL